MTSTTKIRPKVVVFDVDETLGNFSQFSIFTHVLDDYFNKPDISYRHFNDLVDLYPEIIRPNMLRILDYIRKKKNANVCSKVMIYTNNMGPDTWVAHIRKYFEYKLRALHSETRDGGLAITPPLFDHTIGGFKPQDASTSVSSSAFPQRTTKEKTVNDLIRCARIPLDTDICFLDDLHHPKMEDEHVYYIKLQAYHTYIPFHIFVTRFLNSALYRDVFDKFAVSSVATTTPSAVKKQVLSIEIHNLFVKYANHMKYDAKAHQRKMNPREIDEIISKYILYHLQQFFRDGPPQPQSSPHLRKAATSSRSRSTRNSKKNRLPLSTTSTNEHYHTGNVFYIDKTTAIKNMRNKTIRIR